MPQPLQRIAAAMRQFGRLAVIVALAACGGGADDPAGPSVTIASLSVSPDSTDLRPGGTVQLTATPRNAQGAAVSGQSVSWSSGSPAVATVSPAGLVTAVAAGRAVVTATAGGRSSTAVVRVVPAADTLPGAGDALAGGLVPQREVPFDLSHYRTDNPRLPGVPVSVNRLNVLLKPTATAAEVNALLIELEARIIGGLPGGSAGGLLVLQLPTTTSAAIEAARAMVRARPFVQVATTDVRPTADVIPGPNGGKPAQWVFSGTTTGMPWGHEYLYVPAMWNLNDLVRRSGATAVETGVLDVGFHGHEDLAYAVDLTRAVADSHGTHVTGTIAALYDNGKGIDGVNPFARITAKTAAAWLDLVSLIAARPDLRVVSVSLGYNWHKRSIDPSDVVLGAHARDQATDDGQQVHWALLTLQGQRGRLPAIFVSAGNDGAAGRVAEARYNSPYTAAALLHGNQAITVVEAIGQNGAHAVFSDVGGHLSAPGVAIWSTVGLNGFDGYNGTSMATPHLSGLAGYVYALAPDFPAVTATSNPMRDLMLANVQNSLNGAAPSVYATQVTLDLDRVLGGDRILRGLLDIDDGSPDGNLRLDAQGQVETREDIDGDGFRGDGRVDMSDFRRFRDALLVVEHTAGLALDGGANHPKRDLNGDRVVDPAPDLENIWPRADFNGDGRINRDKAAMRGALAGRFLTDLEVLQSRFSDPYYQPAQLSSLIASGDIAVLLSQCAGVAGVATVRLQARVSGAEPVEQQRTVPLAEVHQVLTLPANALGYTVTVEGLDGSGNVVADDEGDLPADIGGDAWFGPVCKEVRISTTPSVLQSVTAGVATPVTVLVEERNPVSAAWGPAAGASLELSMVRGSLSSTSGTTNNLGQAVVGVTWDGTAPGLLVIKARLADGPSRSAQVGVGGAPLSLVGGALPAGLVGAPYSSGVSATGGVQPYQYSILGGALPPGLTLNGTSGAITGVPASAGTFNFTVQVAAGGQTASAGYSITISGGGGSPDPWSGAYKGTSGLVDVGLFIASYHAGSDSYAASIGIMPTGTTTSFYSNSFCSVYNPAGNVRNQTTANLSCSGRGGDLTRSTQVINGVTKRVITATLRNMPNDPADPTGLNTYTVVLVEQ